MHHSGQASFDRVLYSVTPKASYFWHSLKAYFAVNKILNHNKKEKIVYWFIFTCKVNNSYVLRKLVLLLNPLNHPKGSWTRLADSEDISGLSSGRERESNKWELPIADINAPDLYIPLMSFVTYVLLVGYCRGASNKFTPEVNALKTCLRYFNVPKTDLFLFRY